MQHKNQQHQPDLNRMNKFQLSCSFILLFLLTPCFLFAQKDSLVLKLWDKGAPGFENRKNEPEKGDLYISNIHNPSITVYLPDKAIATGAAVLIMPGGGHRMLVINSEGREPAAFFTKLGIAAIVLKYRLARDTISPYKIDVHAPQDAMRAMRLVRSKASSWGIDPQRLGMMGFSAGGEVVDMTAFQSGLGNANSADAIEREPAKPNFIILVYPGPLGVPANIAANAPPAFLVAANEDVCCSPPIVSLLQQYRAAGVPVEAHIFSHGNHAFNMGLRSPYQSLKDWPRNLADWIVDSNYFKKVSAAKP
jgi:acetyl esterase/lipase